MRPVGSGGQSRRLHPGAPRCGQMQGLEASASSAAGAGPLRSCAVAAPSPWKEPPELQLSRRAGCWPLRSGTPAAGPRFLAAPHIRDSQTLAQEGRWFIVGAKAWRSPEQVQLRGAAAEGCGRLVLCLLCGGLRSMSLPEPSWACSWRDAHPPQVAIAVEAGAPVAGLGGAQQEGLGALEKHHWGLKSHLFPFCDQPLSVFILPSSGSFCTS